MLEKIKKSSILSFIFILGVSIVLSLILSYPFGQLYEYVFKFPQGFSTFFVPGYVSLFVNGFFVAYLFSVMVIAILLLGNRIVTLVMLIILTLPIILLFWSPKNLLYANLKIIAVSLILAELILLLKSKLKKPTTA